MYGAVKDELTAQLTALKEEGLYKEEAALTGPQSATITVADGGEVINLCANNYLGLADSPTLIAAAKRTLDEWGFGMASVRFICGTQTLHQHLERAITAFLHPEDPDSWDTILYSSCFDANGGLFEPLFGPQDVIISDELNHASIIDGVRLSKARRLRYRNQDMADLEDRLREAAGARRVVVATDGVFSMDGFVAPLPQICDLADAYGAMVMVDDSHAVGFVGPTGAGTPERWGVQSRVDILTGTLGKALGGASGGYTCSHREVIETLRQTSRPYLFSNSLAPSIAGATLATLDLLRTSPDLLRRLRENTSYFRSQMAARGFDIPVSDHPICPVMIGDAVAAARMADAMLARGIYVRAFSYPVVPRDRARIRTQMSAALTRAQIDRAIEAFEEAREEIG